MDKELWKEKLKNWYKEYNEKLKIEEEKMKYITSSDEYISWLCNYVKEIYYFSDEDWMYFPDTMEKEDRINASKLCLLYQIIDKYAISNNINPEDGSYGNFYRVDYYDFKFDIGVRVDDGIMFYCNEDLDQEKDFIDFNDIIEPKEKVKTFTK